MQLSVERLRVGLLVGAVLLVGVIASFLGYARLRAHRFLKDLPGKMGAELRQETNGFTWSQSREGRTIFTIHAAKELQRRDGKVTLQDVGIVLYGRAQSGATAPAGSLNAPASGSGVARREVADRIYGKEFEYDQEHGVVRAAGEVHIDLQAPIPTDPKAKMDFAAGVEPKHTTTADPEEDRVVHVKTSGVVFLQKLGVASTDQAIEFEVHGLTGEAKGADYNSDTGVLVLHADVSVRGDRNGQPATLRATHAEMNRMLNQIRLTDARYVTAGSGAGAGEETASAEQVVVYGVDGGHDASPMRVEARGSVVLTEGDRTVKGAAGEMVLNPRNQPESAHLSGGVMFASGDAAHPMHGTATEGRGVFDGAGRLQKVTMQGDVVVHETDGMARGAAQRRDLSSGSLELKLATAGTGRQWLEGAVAEGHARLMLVSEGVGGKGAEASEVGGDRLQAQMHLVDGAGQIARVLGDGHTTLHRVNAQSEDTSQGAALDVTFREAAAGTRQEIAQAIQDREVVMTHLGREPGASPEHGTADRAVYEGEAGRVTLTGHVRLRDALSVVSADSVAMLQATGDSTATGSVRASYLQPGTGASQTAGAGDPVHVLAERAEYQRSSGRATFFGGGAAGGRRDAAGLSLARLWQGGSQVEAPVIELNQEERTLRAHGTGKEARATVRTVFSSEARESRQGSGADAGKQEVVRVLSRELTYADAERRADFTGGVVLEDAQGTMRSQRAEVFLQPVGGGAASTVPARGAAGRAGGGKAEPAQRAEGEGGMFAGSVERILATGGVDLEQPGRRGHGEQVIYTAADGFFVLTGTASALPRVVDDVHGTVTGQSLRFGSADKSVLVSGDASRIAGHRVRTETRIGQGR